MLFKKKERIVAVTDEVEVNVEYQIILTSNSAEEIVEVQEEDKERGGGKEKNRSRNVRNKYSFIRSSSSTKNVINTSSIK